VGRKLGEQGSWKQPTFLSNYTANFHGGQGHASHSLCAIYASERFLLQLRAVTVPKIRKAQSTKTFHLSDLDTLVKARSLETFL